MAEIVTCDDGHDQIAYVENSKRNLCPLCIEMKDHEQDKEDLAKALERVSELENQ